MPDKEDDIKPRFHKSRKHTFQPDKGGDMSGPDDQYMNENEEFDEDEDEDEESSSDWNLSKFYCLINLIKLLLTI